MTKHVLLVISHQDRALREAIELTLEGTPGAEGAPAIDVETAKDEERAVLKLRERAFDYIVVGLALARNSKSMVDEYGGLEFCKAARRMTAAPIALLAPELNNAIQIRARDIPKLVPLKVSPSIGQDLVGLVEEAEPPLKRLDVIVYAKEGSDWEYELHGVGFSYTKAGSLRIMNALLTSWRSVAETLSKIDVDWYAPFHALGQSIIEAFCDVNEQFRHQLRVGLELAGGFAHSRVTFVVARAHYHIVLEAIRLPADEVPEPWMIHAPLMRNVAGSGIASANLFDVSQ
ncbi:MAG: hypothetical protein LJE97_10830, partial [Betaproteobacteria bacterium]|nr:hypothetical protein [Betaproteobacteria bacterium]